MRGSSIVCVLLLALAGTACWPGDDEITDSLDAQLRSAAGDWTGTSTGANPIRLEFRLTEGSNGQLSGTGTMKEESAASAVPITVSGTYQRPVLALAFHGMVYEGRSVQGTAQGDYTSVGGVGTTLQLTGTGYSRGVQILLQEK